MAQPSINRFIRLASGEAGSQSTDSRTISFTFATSNVALDGHRILPGAWQSRGHDGLEAFRKNPVFLWGHDTAQPPIGKVITIAEQNGTLSGGVRFASYDFADMIYRLYRDSFLFGVSVSWMPIDWTYATASNRAPGAIDFKKVQLLEISAVTVPADSDALKDADARGLISATCTRAFRASRAVSADIQVVNGVAYDLRIPGHRKLYDAEMEDRDRRSRRARARMNLLKLEEERWARGELASELRRK